MSEENNAPFNTVPPVVVALFLLIMGIEIAFDLGARGLAGGPQAVGWRLDAVQTYGFSALIFNRMLELGQYPAEHLIRFVSYAFIHSSLTQAVFAGVMVLALGNMVGKVFSQLATLLVFVLGIVAGAVIYGLIVDTQFALIGAFPGVYALIGAYSFLLFTHQTLVGGNRLQAFRLIGVLMGIQLIFGLIFGGQPDWIADVGGFIVGFVVSFVLVPGGWRRLRDRLRHR
ncbi:rhomboid family intramembrane serine protease [Thalassobius vesicularis]|uniref:Rhomboid family intramembrane serine protease n=1 Tax=Thalassobius vesicularis TaxID=1294297 RepID=A0A4S3MC77_9RHOB|nr:rhomboid family intramembrane serine protease [Thalassobius vesicularis]THD76373.1 rhomboid family intramembrane serine protease [Thalassobius vesicularis]